MQASRPRRPAPAIVQPEPTLTFAKWRQPLPELFHSGILSATFSCSQQRRRWHPPLAWLFEPCWQLQCDNDPNTCRVYLYPRGAFISVLHRLPRKISTTKTDSFNRCFAALLGQERVDTSFAFSCLAFFVAQLFHNLSDA